MTDLQRATAARNIEAILDAALRLLQRREQATFSAIAIEAGVSRPTVYAHFAMREQLLEALVERAVRNAMQAVEAADVGKGTALEALDRLLDVGWQDIAQHNEVVHAAATALDPKAFHRAHASASTVLSDIFERGQQDGSFRADLPTSWMVATCLALVQAAGHEVQNGGLDTAEAPEILRNTVISAVRATGKPARSSTRRSL